MNIYLAMLHLLPSLTHKRLEELSKKFDGDFKLIWENLDANTLIKMGIENEKIEEILIRKENINSNNLRKYIEEKKIGMICKDDSKYTEYFENIPNPPFVLYYIGNIDLLRKINFSIVGTRKITQYGKQIIDDIIPKLVNANLCIVSGLAYGVDAYVHQKVLENMGNTIAVLGSGVDVPYPSSSCQIYNEIIEKNGLIISDFPIGTKPDNFHFPLRNRIVAGISKGVLVIEAGEKSGSIITANFAFDLGREVFAIPGNIYAIYSKGTNYLIKQNIAHPVTSASDILQILGFHTDIVENISIFDQIQKIDLNLSDSQKIFLDRLSFIPEEEENLLEKSNMNISDFQMELTMLELSGIIKKVEGTKWVRRR